MTSVQPETDKTGQVLSPICIHVLSYLRQLCLQRHMGRLDMRRSLLMTLSFLKLFVRRNLLRRPSLPRRFPSTCLTEVSERAGTFDGGERPCKPPPLGSRWFAHP